MSRRIYICLSVRGAIRDVSRRAPGAKSHATDSETGRPLTNAEFLDGLMDELKQGHEVLPMDSGCGNPCSRAHLGCTVFVYASEGDARHGCPGYSVPDDQEQSA